MTLREEGFPATERGLSWATRHPPRVRMIHMDSTATYGTMVSSRRLAARVRLLHELENGGASSEFLRLYFLLLSELGPADLSAVEHALERHLSRVTPVHY